jgi:mannosyltransferase
LIVMGRKHGKQGERDTGPTAICCDLDEGRSPSAVTGISDLSLETMVALIKGSRYIQILIGLTAVGFLLRFYRLGFNSLWLDEASTLGFARMSLVGIWEATAGGEFNPPLFYWLEHAMLIFGDSEFILRFIPALLGVLTIPVVYLIGKEFFDRNTGLIAAALLTFSPFHVFYSQEARAYAPMLFFFSVALVFYLKALKSNEVRPWALFGIFSALAFWMHFYAAVPIAILILFAFAASAGKIRQDVGNAKNILLSIGVFAGASLPLLIVTANLFLVRTASAPTYGIQGTEIIYQTLLQISGFNEFVLALYLALFALGVFMTWRSDRTGALLLLSLLALPLIVSFFLASRMPMIPRYLIYLLPVFFVGIGASYTAFSSLARSRKVIYLFILAGVILSLPFFASYYSTIQKDDWRGFSSELSQRTADGDIVVVLPGYITQPLDYYYRNMTDGTIELGATTAEELEEIREAYPDRRALYVVTADIVAANPGGDALAWIDQNTVFAGRYTGIYLFTGEGEPSQA